MTRRVLILLAALYSMVLPHTAHAQSSSSDQTFDVRVPPGVNYDTAAFRVWFPSGGPSRAVVVLMPGSGEDGRAQVDDSVWQAFATTHHVALLGCYVTDHPHAQGFIEEYADVSKGSGQAVLTALTMLAQQSAHRELAEAPLLLWGMSAGGEFNYEFVAWKPERVLGFIVNKGGIYYTALAPATARAVPGLLFVGGKDIAFRTQTITGLFSVNRRAGALWALTEEPSAGHIVGQSRALALVFFDEVLAARLPQSQESQSTEPLKAMDERAGFLGDLSTKAVQPVESAPAPNVPTAWLPSKRVALAWHAVVTDTPISSSLAAEDH